MCRSSRGSEALRQGDPHKLALSSRGLLARVTSGIVACRCRTLSWASEASSFISLIQKEMGVCNNHL